MTAQSEQGAIPPSAANQMETTDLADPGRLAGNPEVILAYDVETLRAVYPGADKTVPGVEYVPDWSDASKRQMGVACCCFEEIGTGAVGVYTGDPNHPLFSRWPELQRVLGRADLLVSFGGGDWTDSGFDNEVLAGTGIEVDRTKCFDLRLAIKRATGGSLPKGLTLGKLAQANADPDFPSLGRGKTGDGALAPQLWAEGRYQEVVDYCLDGDVKMTADLCRKLIRDGYLILPGGDRVTIDWPGQGASSLPVLASDLEVSSGKEVVSAPVAGQQPDPDLGPVDHGDGTGNRGGDDDASVHGSELAELPGERGEKDVGPVKHAAAKPVGKTEKSASLRTSVSLPAFAGKPVGNSLPEPVGKTPQKPVGNPVGILVGKQASGQQKQQVARIDWFRHELDFRQNKKGGAWVLIRRRLRWSKTRYSKTFVRQFCPQLTGKMIDQISVGKFSKEAIAALQNGGIQHVVISDLQKRIGRGNGRRKAELTDLERSLLARIESSIRASNRGGDN